IIMRRAVSLAYPPCWRFPGDRKASPGRGGPLRMNQRAMRARRVTMGRLSHTDAAEFLAIKAPCYKGLDSASLRERAGERLARHLRAPSFCFGATDPASALPVHSVTVGLGPGAMGAFFRLFLATPSLDFGPWVTRPQRVAPIEELVDEVDRDPYMTE